MMNFEKETENRKDTSKENIEEMVVSKTEKESRRYERTKKFAK